MDLMCAGRQIRSRGGLSGEGFVKSGGIASGVKTDVLIAGRYQSFIWKLCRTVYSFAISFGARYFFPFCVSLLGFAGTPPCA